MAISVEIFFSMLSWYSHFQYKYKIVKHLYYSNLYHYRPKET